MKEARHKRPHVVQFHVYEMSRIGIFVETKSSTKGQTANSYVVSFGDDGNVLKLYCDDGCSTLNILKIICLL